MTSDTVQINLKNVPQFMRENRANFWLTSNDPAPFVIAERERRAFVHIPRRAKRDQERYHALDVLLERGGAAALLHHAREKYDAAAFNPRAEAPDTMGRRAVALSGRSSARDWVITVVGPGAGLSRSFATPREIYALFAQEVHGAERITPDTLGREIAAAGAIRWDDGALITTRGEGGATRRERVWILDPGSAGGAIDMQAAHASAPPFGRVREGARGEKVVPIRRKF